jgi:PAS domain S-box-containing protein
MTGYETTQFIQGLVSSKSGWAMFVVDFSGNIQSWTDGAVVLFGYERAEVEGRHFSLLYTPQDIAAGEPSAELKTASAQGVHRDVGARVGKKGDKIECEFIVHPLSEKDIPSRGYAYVIRDRSPRGPVAHVATAATHEGRQTILVVDDDKGMRAVAALQLARLGYDVIEASGGSEALAVLGKGTKVDLLFTDVMMPEDIGGRDLAVEARKLRSDLKILFTSGYFETALSQRGDLERNVHFIAKPYRKAELARKIQQLLSS